MDRRRPAPAGAFDRPRVIQQSGMDPQDAAEIERYYATLSSQIRLFGAEHLGRRYVVVRLARMEVTGPLDFSDLQRILGRVVDLRTWYPAFHQDAVEAEQMAERAEAAGHRVSAAAPVLPPPASRPLGED